VNLYRWLAALTTAAALGLPATAYAQMSAGLTLARDRALWHFENPSSYDTTTLVPHDFEQDYTLDNAWLDASVRYRAGIDWQTTVAATLPRTQAATDYDTFFNPGSVTWVSGTRGDARVHGLGVTQSVSLGRTAGLTLTGGYRVRVDLADFLPGERTDTRNGVVVSRQIVTSREFTNGQLHEVFVSASRDWSLGRRWSARVTGEASPAAVNRLAIRLPDKYPGRTLLYRTTNAVTAGAFEVAGGNERLPVTLGLSATRSWNYSRTQWARRSSLSLTIRAGHTW
jgi:hypothetical protein